MGQPTLYEVADRAGVSLATASRVLNGSTRTVGEALRLRVMAAAQELHYSANGPAQAMARGHNNTVGLIVSDIADPYFTQIAAGVIEAAEKAGLVVTMGTTGGEPDRELDHLGGFRSQRANGVVIVGSRRHGDRIEPLADHLASYGQHGGRVVLVSQPVGEIPCVEVDNRKLAAELARALVDQGHREFAVLAGPTDLVTSRDRLTGFRNGLRSRQQAVPAENVVHGAFTRAGGHASMTALLGRNRSPGCVFAVNDVMALGAMAAIEEAGLQVGRDVPIAGFDDIPTLADVRPTLSTVRVPLREAGHEAVRLLTEPGGGHVVLSGEVVLRDSTARTD
ncbi:MAG: LacI family transcriptional regulator [Propionibacteriales bacterium]|nr:LacI family transcriptional regulator [Propionibacteriales bacterium]